MALIDDLEIAAVADVLPMRAALGGKADSTELRDWVSKEPTGIFKILSHRQADELVWQMEYDDVHNFKEAEPGCSAHISGSCQRRVSLYHNRTGAYVDAGPAG